MPAGINPAARHTHPQYTLAARLPQRNIAECERHLDQGAAAARVDEPRWGGLALRRTIDQLDLLRRTGPHARRDRLDHLERLALLVQQCEVRGMQRHRLRPDFLAVDNYRHSADVQ